MRRSDRSSNLSVSRALASTLLLIVATTTASCGDASGPPSRDSFAGSGAVAVAPAAPTPQPQELALQEQSASRSASQPEASTIVDAAVSNIPRLPSQFTAPSNAMIIRSGVASVQVDSLEIALAALQRSTTAVGGFVGNTMLALGEDQVRRATIELKLPAAQYDAAIAGLSPLGKVESVNSTAQDVGEEFVDLSARVANAKRLEARLIALLETRTGRLQDALAVERELSRVREEIERMEGRARYLSARAAMSTLTVMLHEPFPILRANPGENILLDAAQNAWRLFVRVVAAFIASLGLLIPVGLIAGASVFAWRRRTRVQPSAERVSIASK